MKIVVMGYSGSGKSTLARKFGEWYGTDVLHLDRVQWQPGWKARDNAEKQRIVGDFLDSHDAWVIDGNYRKLYEDRRLNEADVIVELLFGRFNCYCRARKRLKIYRGKSRPDMGDGCEEKVDLEFTKWIFFGGRTKAIREHFKEIPRLYPKKTIVIKNQRQLDRFIAECEADIPVMKS